MPTGCGTSRTRSTPRWRGRPAGWPGLLRVALDPAGLNLVHATGTAAWQSVFHFHTHVVPRYRADELQLMWQSAPAPEADLAALRDRVLRHGF